MSRPADIILTLADATPEAIEGRTFQVHRLPGNKLQLIEVLVVPRDPGCPVFIGGERCGLPFGHGGKHRWSGGD